MQISLDTYSYLTLGYKDQCLGGMQGVKCAITGSWSTDRLHVSPTAMGWTPLPPGLLRAVSGVPQSQGEMALPDRRGFTLWHFCAAGTIVPQITLSWLWRCWALKLRAPWASAGTFGKVSDGCYHLGLSNSEVWGRGYPWTWLPWHYEDGGF